MIYLLLLPFFLSGPAKKSDHAVYISVLEIDGREMKVKVFSDDLEDAIRYNSSTIEEYFREKIRFRVNDQKISFNLKDISEEGDSHRITFLLETTGKWQSFYLEADYFMELFPDQVNVVKIIGEKPQYFKLTRQNSSCSFSVITD